MTVGVVVVALVVLVGVGGGLLLYLLVRREAADRPTMDRDRAERVARRDTGDDRRDRR